MIEEVKRDLNGWKLGRVVLVADTGFNSEHNRRILQGAGGHYILGLHRTRSGEVWQTTRPTADQARIFQALTVTPPPRYYALPKPRRHSPCFGLSEARQLLLACPRSKA